MIVRSTRVLLSSDGPIAPASIHVKAGRVERVEPWEVPIEIEAPVIDFGDRLIMAGVVDTHVHVNEPGRTEWEGFATATRAAAAGGVIQLRVHQQCPHDAPTVAIR